MFADAWLTLRSTVDVCLNEVEQIYNRGGLLVLDHLAGLPEQPELAGPQTDENTHTGSAGYALPNNRPRGALAPDFLPTRRLRLVSAAIDVLERHQPRDVTGAEQMVDDLRKRMWRLVWPASTEDPPPPNGHGPTH